MIFFRVDYEKGILSNLENQICLDRNEFRLWLSQICRDTYFDVEVQAFNSDLNQGSLDQDYVSWPSLRRPCLDWKGQSLKLAVRKDLFSAAFELSRKLRI